HGKSGNPLGDYTGAESQSTRSAIPLLRKCPECAGAKPVLPQCRFRPAEHAHGFAAATPTALSAIYRRERRMELSGRLDLPRICAQSGEAVLPGFLDPVVLHRQQDD